MKIKSAAMPGVPESAALLQPWVTSPPLCDVGMLLGPSMETRDPELFHPWRLKEQRRIHSTIFEITAQKDHGKGVLAKWIQAGLMKFQAGLGPDGYPEVMRVRNNDRKREKQEPEYGPITEFFGGEVVSLNRAGLINVFDILPGMSELDLIDIAINVAEDVRGLPLTDHMTLAIQVGVWRMLTQSRGIASPEVLEVILRSLDLSDVQAYFDRTNENVLSMFEDYRGRKSEEELSWLKLCMGYDPSELTIRVNDKDVDAERKEINFTEGQFRHDAGVASTLYGQLLRGNYGRVFGGMNSLLDKLGAPMVDFDWTDVPPKAATMLEALFFKWQDIAMGSPELEHILPHLDIGDEEHEAFNNLMHVRYYSSYIAKARQLKTARFIVTQFESDLLMAGEPGSEIRRHAEKIIRGIAGRFIGQMEKDDETKHRLSQLGISEYDIEFLTIIPMGCFGVTLQGEPIRFVQVIPPPTILKLAETNSAAKAMTETVHWQSIESVRERAQLAGIL
jgi:hypothetical protein